MFDRIIHNHVDSELIENSINSVRDAVDHVVLSLDKNTSSVNEVEKRIKDTYILDLLNSVDEKTKHKIIILFDIELKSINEIACSTEYKDKIVSDIVYAIFDRKDHIINMKHFYSSAWDCIIHAFSRKYMHKNFSFSVGNDDLYRFLKDEDLTINTNIDELSRELYPMYIYETRFNSLMDHAWRSYEYEDVNKYMERIFCLRFACNCIKEELQKMFPDNKFIQLEDHDMYYTVKDIYIDKAYRDRLNLDYDWKGIPKNRLEKYYYRFKENMKYKDEVKDYERLATYVEKGEYQNEE